MSGYSEFNYFLRSISAFMLMSIFKVLYERVCPSVTHKVVRFVNYFGQFVLFLLYSNLNRAVIEKVI